MTPETADYLDKARQSLAKARNLLDVLHYGDEGARAAYLAGFHAAQPLIFARLGRVVKSHSGLRSTFAQLAKEDPRIEREFTRFLARAYRLKEIADYGIGSQSEISMTEAQEMIKVAARFIDRMSENSSTACLRS